MLKTRRVCMIFQNCRLWWKCQVADITKIKAIQIKTSLSGQLPCYRDYLGYLGCLGCVGYLCLTLLSQITSWLCVCTNFVTQVWSELLHNCMGHNMTHIWYSSIFKSLLIFCFPAEQYSPLIISCQIRN